MREQRKNVARSETSVRVDEGAAGVIQVVGSRHEYIRAYAHLRAEMHTCKGAPALGGFRIGGFRGGAALLALGS